MQINQKHKKERILHKNIEFLLQKYSMDISSLSAETGVPITTIHRMKKSDNNPTITSIEPIAEFFNLELNDILYEDLSSDVYQNKKKIGNIVYIPLANLEDIKSWPIKFDKNVFIGALGILSENSFGIAIDTNSMAPIFLEDTIIIIDPEIKPKDSDYVLCLIELNKIPVLRQLFVDGSNYFFKPISPNYGDITNIKDYKIIGVVVKSIENYR